MVRASGSQNSVQTVSYAFMLMMAGATAGYLSLIWFTEILGRRWSYFLFCAGSLLTSLYLFNYVRDLDNLLWVMAIYGYFVIGGFGTFALYLPELFPTRVRASVRPGRGSAGTRHARSPQGAPSWLALCSRPLDRFRRRPQHRLLPMSLVWWLFGLGRKPKVARCRTSSSVVYPRRRSPGWGFVTSFDARTDFMHRRSDHWKVQ